MRRQAAPSLCQAPADSSSPSNYSTPPMTTTQSNGGCGPVLSVVQCWQSPLQRTLKGAIDQLMTLDDETNALFLRLLANHPALLWMKVREKNEELLGRRPSKKKQAFLTLDPVLRAFPASFASDALSCAVGQSGKMKELFQLVTGFNTERVVVATYSSITMDLLAALFHDAAHCAVVRVDANIPAPCHEEKMTDTWVIPEDPRWRPLVVLLNARYYDKVKKDELIGDSPLIFFDEPGDPKTSNIPPPEALAQGWGIEKGDGAKLLQLYWQDDPEESGPKSPLLGGRPSPSVIYVKTRKRRGDEDDQEGEVEKQKTPSPPGRPQIQMLGNRPPPHTHHPPSQIDHRPNEMGGQMGEKEEENDEREEEKEDEDIFRGIANYGAKKRRRNFEEHQREEEENGDGDDTGGGFGLRSLMCTQKQEENVLNEGQFSQPVGGLFVLPPSQTTQQQSQSTQNQQQPLNWEGLDEDSDEVDYCQRSGSRMRRLEAMETQQQQNLKGAKGERGVWPIFSGAKTPTKNLNQNPEKFSAQIHQKQPLNIKKTKKM